MVNGHAVLHQRRRLRFIRDRERRSTLRVGATLTDRRWLLRQYRLYDGTIMVGYLKVVCIDPIAWAMEYPTRWNFLTNGLGACRPTEAEAEQAYTSWASYLEKADREITADHARFNYHFVDCIRVADKRDISKSGIKDLQSTYRGMGLGPILYKAAAKHLKPFWARIVR